MRTRQNGFIGVSKAAALGWARGPGERRERYYRHKSHLSQGDAFLLEGRRVPSDGQYLDTIRQTRLALLSE